MRGHQDRGSGGRSDPAVGPTLARGPIGLLPLYQQKQKEPGPQPQRTQMPISPLQISLQI